MAGICINFGLNALLFSWQKLSQSLPLFSRSWQFNTLQNWLSFCYIDERSETWMWTNNITWKMMIDPPRKTCSHSSPSQVEKDEIWKRTNVLNTLTHANNTFIYFKGNLTPRILSWAMHGNSFNAKKHNKWLKRKTHHQYYRVCVFPSQKLNISMEHQSSSDLDGWSKGRLSGRSLGRSLGRLKGWLGNNGVRFASRRERCLTRHTTACGISDRDSEWTLCGFDVT